MDGKVTKKKVFRDIATSVVKTIADSARNTRLSTNRGLKYPNSMTKVKRRRKNKKGKYGAVVKSMGGYSKVGTPKDYYKRENCPNF